MQERRHDNEFAGTIKEHITEQRLLEQERQSDVQNIAITSRGEYILPFFIAGMEACWINAALIGLAGLGFLGSKAPLMPFWGPPLLLLVTMLLFRRAAQKEAEAEDAGKTTSSSLLAIPGLRLMFGVVAVLTLLLVWLHLYAATYSLFDPGWLLAFGGDVLALDSNLFAMIATIAVAIYCAWRGMKLAQLEIKPKNLFRHVWAPEQIFRQLWIGLLVFIAAILVRVHLSSKGVDDVILFLLVPIFLYCALSAHALARIVLVRNEHPFGLEGSIAAQERSVLSIVGIVGVALGLLTIIGGTAFSSAFFTSIQPVWSVVGTLYNWLAEGIAQVLTWLTMPFFGLFSALLSSGLQHINTQQNGTQNVHRPPVSKVRSTPPVAAIVVIKILIPVLIFLALGLVLWLVLRNRKRLRVSLNRKTGDVHESIWSWQLFWSQFKAFLLGFFRRFFPTPAASEAQAGLSEEINASPAARSVREMYRALLKKAAQRGHARKRDETPHEFRLRLNSHEANNEPQLGMLTDVYALTRYGGDAPNEHELTIVRQLWNELEQKWHD